MAITPESLNLFRNLRVLIGNETDSNTRALTRAWRTTWEELSKTWEAGLTDAARQAIATGGAWPGGSWQLARMERIQAALRQSESALATLARRSGVIVNDGVRNVVATTAEMEPRLIASQLPAGKLGYSPKAFRAKVTPTALDAMVARIQGQITSLTRPLSLYAANAMRRELIKGIAVGDNPNVVAKAMLDRVQGAFEGGLTRAVNIARTEMLDAYRTASRYTHAANADVLEGWIWWSALDKRTCFPPGTPIRTQRGEIPIEAVREGDVVLTHAGRWQRVCETMSRPYVGRMVTVEAGPLRVTATADHPFLIERQGELHWVQAQHIRRGDRVFSDRQAGTYRIHHGLGEVAVEGRGDQAHNGEAARLQEHRLGCVPFGDAGLVVPVRLVDLEGDTDFGEQEIDGSLPADDDTLLGVIDTERVEREPHVAFGDGLAGVSAVAAHRAEAVPIGRDDTHAFATGEAFDLNGRPAALLGAVASRGSLLDIGESEDFSVSFARRVDGVGSSARERTGDVPVGVAARHGELSLATRASLRDRVSRVVASPAAVGVWPHGASGERRTTVLAGNDGPRLGYFAPAGVGMFALMGGVAVLAAESATTSAYPCCGNLELDAASVAGSFHSHIVSNVEHHIQATVVYNFEVEEDHTYVAAGFVVHNCPACWSMHGKVFPVTTPGPLDHQQGRCARMPKTKSWKSLGIDVDEPPDVTVDPQAKFWGMSPDSKLAIMGPRRLELLRSGRIGWGDLAQQRGTVGWRPSYNARAVTDLERLAARRKATGAAARPPAKAPKAPITSADKMTVAQLRALAKANGFTIPSGLNKTDTIKYIRQWEIGNRKILPGRVVAPKPVKAPPAKTTPPPSRNPAELTGNKPSTWHLDIKDDTGFDNPIPVRNLILVRQSVAPDYLVKSGLVYRKDGIAFLIENGSGVDPRLIAMGLSDTYKAIPTTLRSTYQKAYAWLQGANPADAYWERAYNWPGFLSQATAHDGRTHVWSQARLRDTPASLRESLRHEFGHNVSHSLRLQQGAVHDTSAPWLSAVVSDRNAVNRVHDVDWSATVLLGHRPSLSDLPTMKYPYGVSKYGASSSAEDYAESVKFYLMGRMGKGRLKPGGPLVDIYFRDLWPARAKLLDQIFPDVAKKQRAALRARRS